MIWSDDDSDYPSYIGEGNLRDRIGAHIRNKGFFKEGLYTVTSKDDSSNEDKKDKALILEAFLIWLEWSFGFKGNNRNDGQHVKLRDMVEKQAESGRTVTIRIGGYNVMEKSSSRGWIIGEPMTTVLYRYDLVEPERKFYAFDWDLPSEWSSKVKVKRSLTPNMTLR